MFFDMKGDVPPGGFGKPFNQSVVSLLCCSIHELLTQCCLCFSVTCKQDDAGRVLVETMDHMRTGGIGIVYFPEIPKQIKGLKDTHQIC